MHLGSDTIRSSMEVSEYLVGSPAFKAGGTGDPRPAGSIPVHLRQFYLQQFLTIKNRNERNHVKKLLLAIVVGALVAIAARKLSES